MPTYVVTGGAGFIGSNFVRLVLERRPEVRIIDIDLLTYAGNLENLADLPPDRHTFVRADITDPEAMTAAAELAVARFGRIDHCVANAGVYVRPGARLDEMSPERVRASLDVNLLGALWTARAFLGALARTGARPDGRGASLTFIGSTAGRFGERGHVDYAASKAALRGAVKTLKNEIVTLDPYGRVNLVQPGWTVTAMAREALAEPGAVNRIVRTMPLRQLARPVDIARAVLFLASPEAARHVSGEVITVAGGMEGRLLWAENEIDEGAIHRRVGLGPEA
jgi:3-oxoacyl-[acyl-carrier protein] reductase